MSEEQRILVAVGVGQNPGDPPTIILGMTDATWADLNGGKAHDIDLQKLGIPAILLVMRGTDHDDITRQLQSAAAALHMPTGGLTDLSFPKPKGH